MGYNINLLDSTEKFGESKKYWLERLSGDARCLNIPGDNTDADCTGYESINLDFEGSLAERLLAVSRGQDLALYVLLLGALKVMLYKYTGERDITVGSPVFLPDGAEERPEYNRYVVFRDILDGSVTFRQFLGSLKETVVQGYMNQHYPMDRIFEILGIDAGDSSFMKMILCLDGIHDNCAMIEALESGRTDMAVSISRQGSSIRGEVKFKPGLYKKTTVTRLMEFFMNTLHTFEKNPDVRLDDMQIMTEEEKNRVLYLFNDTRACYPSEKPVHRLFEEQAERHPDKTAVVFGETRLTYGELNDKSNRLAVLLRTKGIKADSIVGIMAERSAEMITGILGILKAGGAYLPIDPEQPAERVRFMLEDSGARILLAQSSMCGRIECEADIISLDDGVSYKDCGSNPEEPSAPDSLVYVIYTSGTTGMPKGVLVENRNLVNYVSWFIDKAGLSKDDRTVLLSSYAFDLGYTSLFSSLLAGCELHIVPKDFYLDPENIIKYIEQNGITYIKCTPSLFNTIANSGSFSIPGVLKTLRLLVLGGEPINLQDVERLRGLYPGMAVMNHYGPTETTVGAVAQFVDFTGFEDFKRNPAIGNPVSNTRVYILNACMEPLPVGVTGEIYISGDGVARGYLNRQDLNEQRFLPDRFSGSGQRMYKTGDLGRFLPDGRIEFLGRTDHQVKIRGYRVELSEIENRLQELEYIKETFVTVKEGAVGGKFLCAYIVSEGELELRELRKQLGGVLPEYMIPSHFIRLERLPLTPNGKVDGKALPEPENSVGTGTEYAAPGNAVESVLAMIWQEVLGFERIGTRDNFFELGGDSIKAIQISARIQKFNLRVDIKDIFQHPVIEELAKHVRQSERRIFQGTVTGSAGLTPIQKRFFENYHTGIHHYNQCVMLYRKEGFSEGLVRNAFLKITEHHDAFRMIFRNENGVWIQYNRGLEEVCFTMEVFELSDEENCKERIKKEADRVQGGMNLENGILSRLALFKTRDGDHLLIAVHHLVMDGVSWRILLEDFVYAYMQTAGNSEVRFPEKTDSFKVWSEELQAYATGDSLAREAKYWSNIEKAGLDELPRDFAVKDRRRMDMEEISVTLPPEETGALLRNANRAYNTEINDILLAALGLALKKWAGMHRILISMEGHGREEISEDLNTARTTGWFTSVYPVLLDMADRDNIPHTVRSIKENLRHIPVKGIGYGILRYLTPPESMEGTLLCKNPEITFNYLGQIDQDINTGVFELSGMPTGATVSPDLEAVFTLEIGGIIAGGMLTMTFGYSRLEYKAETIMELAECYMEKLKDIIEHCKGIEESCLTPYDTGNSELSLEEFDFVYGKFGNNLQKIYSLSPMQEGMLFHSMMNGGDGMYFEQFSYFVDGKLDTGLLEKALNIIIGRYDVFRTVYLYERVSKPQQLVLKERSTNIYLADISLMPEDEKNRYIADFMKNDSSRGFDLSKDVLVRLSVLKTDTDTYKIVWGFHHIIMDGWCVGVAMEELFQVYKSLVDGRPAELPETNPYGNYIRWVEGQNREEASAYWEKYLEGYAQVTTVPGHERNTEKGAYIKEEICVELDSKITKGLCMVAKNNHVTLYTVFQAIWGILLKVYNNTDDVLFGSVVSGRPSEIEGIEKMVGLFINTIPTRVRFDDSKTFSALLQELQQFSIDAEKYNYYPLADILSKKDMGSDLIEEIIIFENYPVEQAVENSGTIRELGLAVRDMENCWQTNYNLNVMVVPGEKLLVRLNYNSMVYSRDTLQRVMEHFAEATGKVISDPDVLINDIEIITAKEKNRLLFDFNRTETGYEKDCTVHSLFEKQVEKTPWKTAVIFGDDRLTYSQLNMKANQLAHRLRISGVGPDSIVGLMVRRSLEMIIGILGVLKAGGAYLPLDPEYPDERIGYMLEDSGAAILISQKELRSKAGFNGEVIDIEDPVLYSGDYSDPEPVNSPSDLAYVIYTSGSTGKPKGVMIEHKAVNNFIKGITDRIDFSINKTILSLTTFSFDIFVLETLLPLSRGLAIVIADENQLRDPAALNELILDCEVDMIQTTPSRMQLLMSSDKFDCLVSLSEIMVGGEAFPDTLLKSLNRLPRSTRIYNMYGPTETTVWSTLQNLTEAGAINIGKPIANTEIYILDSKNRLLPQGVAGELCIGGEGLSRGYFKREELTAQKFIRNPYCPGKRIYKTGDLARWLSDGNIECLGRTDHQVKIRGYRIELGEVETLLTEHESVREAAVTAGEDENGNKYLCAYYVSDSELGVPELRGHLLKNIPDYMVPSYFARLEKLPLTPNGKIDRKALPAPNGHIRTDAEYAAPRNETEEKLARVWQEVLGVEKVGIDDNFILLGGHSLKAIRVVSVAERIGIKLKIRDIFEYQTIRLISDSLTARERPCGFVTGIEEAGKAIFEKFNVFGRLIRMNVDNNDFYLLMIDDSVPVSRESIMEFADSSFCEEIKPGYIIVKPFEELEKITQNDLDGEDLMKVLGFGEVDTGYVKEQLSLADEQLRREFEEKILSNGVSESYPLSPSQKIRLEFNEATGTCIRLDRYVDYKLLEEAVYELIKSQGLMRSVIGSENGAPVWKEYGISDRISIPFIDLMPYRIPFQERALQYIVSDFYSRGIEDLSMPLYKILLVRKNLKEHYLFMPFSHIIHDGMSSEIIRKSITGYPDGIARMPSYKEHSFMDYVRQVEKGPSGMEREEIKEVYKIDRYADALDTFSKKVRHYKGKAGTEPTVVNLKIALNGRRARGADPKPVELALETMQNVLRRYFEMPEIPLCVISFGRSYESASYFNTVGEFIDYIPVLMELDSNAAEIAAGIQEKVTLASRHNINFAGLVSGGKLGSGYSGLFRRILVKRDLIPVMFNFQGVFDDEEAALSEEVVYKNPAYTSNMKNFPWIGFLARSSREYLYFTVILPFNEDKGILMETIEGVQELNGTHSI